MGEFTGKRVEPSPATDYSWTNEYVLWQDAEIKQLREAAEIFRDFGEFGNFSFVLQLSTCCNTNFVSYL